MEGANYPISFNCSAGKDRTGWAAAIVLMLLGASREQIKADFLFSNECIRGTPWFETSVPRMMGRVKKAGLTISAAISDVERVAEGLMLVFPEYIDTAFEALDGKWGTSDNYIERGLGVSAAQRAAFALQMLDGPHRG